LIIIKIMIFFILIILIIIKNNNIYNTNNKFRNLRNKTLGPEVGPKRIKWGPSPLGPDAWLITLGSWRWTQENWVVKWVPTQNLLTLDPDAWIITLRSWRRIKIGSGLKTHWSWILHRAQENKVLSLDPTQAS